MELKNNENRKPNRLINEKSPYLLQHAHNPVDWYPWGEEAFEKAKKEDKPIFMSIGYSTCHWCHVMEKESFEDEEVANVINQSFVAIKVDREERPDIDHIYMSVCQALTGQGGWPLTILMTPDKKAFFAGTYFPKHDRMGMHGILTLLSNVNELWKADKTNLVNSSEEIHHLLMQTDAHGTQKDLNIEKILHATYESFHLAFDKDYGGFASAPKFPSPHILFFLLRYWHLYKNETALAMVEKTLDAMARGGIYDHIGFGFSRYATDKKWLLPHFEKMLYDNALLAIAYTETSLATKNEKYAKTAKQIFTYVLRDMTSPEGGFYSAEDADSEGVEGKFYRFTMEDIKQILGDENGQKFCDAYDITIKGNFEGYNIPNQIKAALSPQEATAMEQSRQKLFDYREKRVHPYKDDKILTSWNGLMIAALAIGGRSFGNKEYTAAAEKAFGFISEHLIRNDGRLMARYRQGDTAHMGYVDDYAFLIWALIELFETTQKASYLEKAVSLNESLLQLFWDEENGGLFLYGSDSEQLITRPKEIYDGATPSGNAVATLNFLKLARLTEHSYLEEKAHQQLKCFSKSISQYSQGHAYSLLTLLYMKAPAKEVVLVNGQKVDGIDQMLDVVYKEFRPFTLIRIAPFTENYRALHDEATAYVCKNHACQAPTTDIQELRDLL